MFITPFHPTKQPTEYALWATEYIRLLEPWPVDVIAPAMNRVVASHKGSNFPKPAHLLEACTAIAGRDRPPSRKPEAERTDQDLGGQTPELWVQCHRYVAEKEPVDHADWWTPKTWACARRWLRLHPDWQRQATDEGWLDTHLFPWLVTAYRTYRAQHFKQHNGSPPGDPPFADWAPPTALLPLWREQKAAAVKALSGAHEGVKRMSEALAQQHSEAKEDAA